MAVAKLGAIFTNMAGSIGGTTVRRTATGLSLSNKNMGGSKTKRRNNNQLLGFSWIFQQWKLLSEDQRQAWKEFALTKTYPDKFGDPKHLTPRQMFTRCNTALTVVGAYSASPNPLLSEKAEFTHEVAANSFGDSDITIKIDNITVENYFLIGFEASPFPIFSNRMNLKTEKWSVSDNSTDMNIFPQILAKYPNIQPGWNVRYVVTPMSPISGRGTNTQGELVVAV